MYTGLCAFYQVSFRFRTVFNPHKRQLYNVDIRMGGGRQYSLINSGNLTLASSVMLRIMGSQTVEAKHDFDCVTSSRSTSNKSWPIFVVVALCTVNAFRGYRWSTATAYLRPSKQKHRTNLHVISNAQVTRIVIDPVTKTATGVEFMVADGGVSPPALRLVTADKEIVRLHKTTKHKIITGPKFCSHLINQSTH